MYSFRKAAAVFGAAIVLFTPFRAAAELSPEQENCPDFSQIRSAAVITGAHEELLNRLNAIADSKDTSRSEEARGLLSQLLSEYIHMETVCAVYEIEYSCDPSDSNTGSSLIDTSSEALGLYNDISDCVNNLYSKGFKDILRNVSGYDLELLFVDEDSEDYDKLNNDKLMELFGEEEKLQNRYQSCTQDSFAVEYEGKSYTRSDLAYADPDSDETARISRLIYEKQNKQLGELFLELLDVRREIAQLSGYDNYAEYAHNVVYLRDYSYEDTDSIYSAVKKNYSQLSEAAKNAAGAELFSSGLYDLEINAEGAIDLLAPFFEKLGGSVGENFSHMRSHDLYDVSGSDTKVGTSYMTPLYEYSVPYLFISPSEDYNDILSVLHEFGHTNEEYINPSDCLYDRIVGSAIDTSEMHSNGMQALFMSCSGEYLGEEMGKAYNLLAITDLADSVIEGCLYDEFQKYAYETPDCTLEMLNRKFAELCREYGRDFSPEDPFFTDWTEIDHNFTSPMYYITYATSAISVLDMWISCGNDTDKMMKTYEKMVDCSKYIPYNEACESCGILSIFDEGAVYDTACQALYYIDNGEFDDSFVPTAERNSHKDKEIPGETTFQTSETNTEHSSITTISRKISDESDKDGSDILISAIVGAAAVCGGVLVIVIVSVAVSDRKRRK